VRGADHLSHRLSLAQFTLKLLFVFFFTGSDHKKVADMSYSSYIVICVLNGVLGCTAVVFNCLTIHAIRKISSLSAGSQPALPGSSALPIPLKILLISMAVSDLGVGLLVQPLTIAVYVLDLKGESTIPVLYESMNTICLIPASFFTYASFFSVTALTIDRFLALYLHLRYKELVTRKRIVSVVIFIWILSAVLSLVYRLSLIETADGFFIAMEVLCLVVNAAIYCKIYEVVRRHTKHLKTLQVQQETQRSDIANVAKIVRSTISIFYVFVVFSICYIPCVTIHVASAAIRTASSGQLQGTWIEQVHPYTGILLFLNSSLNPFIYCWKMRRIRFAIKSLILRPSVKENGQRSQQEDYYLR